MVDTPKTGALDFDTLWERALHLEEGDELDPAAVRDLVMQLGPDHGFSSEACEAHLSTPRGTADLVRTIRRQANEGDTRFTEVCRRAAEARIEGGREAARQVVRDFIRDEPVPLFREAGEHLLSTLGPNQVIAERSYCLCGPEHGAQAQVTLRIGTPEQVYGPRWLLPFEILGPGEQRIERDAAIADAVDAVQALHGPWAPTIVAELRALEERTGGTLCFQGEAGLGFNPPRGP